MKKLALDTDRSGSGVLVSDEKSRDIHIDSYTLSFHGRLLIENASVTLNYGQRYGLLGENGSGKVSGSVTKLASSSRSRRASERDRKGERERLSSP